MRKKENINIFLKLEFKNKIINVEDKNIKKLNLSPDKANIIIKKL